MKILRQDSEPAPATVSPRVNGFDEEAEEGEEEGGEEEGEDDDDGEDEEDGLIKKKGLKTPEKVSHPSPLPILSNFAPVRVFQCSACHQQGTYKWVVERHIRAKHPDQGDAHVIELPAELSVKLQKITSPLKRFRCSLCSLQSKHSWVVMRVTQRRVHVYHCCSFF